MEAAEALKRVRRAAGLSQQQLAARARVTQQVVSRIETGRSQPTLPALRRLIEAAGGSIGYDVGEPLGEHDRGLLAQSLAQTPEQRLRQSKSLHRFAIAGRAAVAAQGHGCDP